MLNTYVNSKLYTIPLFYSWKTIIHREPHTCNYIVTKPETTENKTVQTEVYNMQLNTKEATKVPAHLDDCP